MSRKLLLLLVLGLLLIFTNHSTAEESNEVTCTGKVVDEQGKPIAGVKVSLYENVYDEKNNLSDFRLSSEITTKADGKFNFSKTIDSNSRSYGYVVTEKEGLAAGWANWSMRRDEEIEIKLGQAKELTGFVVDENDKPVEQAEISMYMLLLIDGTQRRYLSGQAAQRLFTGKTDESGKFIFSNLPAEATVEFLLKKQGRATICTYTSSRTLSYSPDQSDIRLVQPVEAKIEGIAVEKDTGQPVADVKMMISQELNRSLSGQEPINSKADGTFSINALPAGRYFIQLVTQRDGLADWVAEPVEVTTEADKTKSGVKLELCKGGILEILVTEAQNNQPIGNASVTVMEQSGNLYFHNLSKEDGIARIRLMPGEYRVNTIYKQGFARESLRPEPITIEDGKTKRIECQLMGQPKVSGIVRDDKGIPLKDIKLNIWPMGYQDVKSTAEGKFEITWDPERLPSSQSGSGYLIIRDEEKNLAEAMEIDAETKSLDIKLQPGIIITGKIADTNNQAINGAELLVYLYALSIGAPIGHDSVKANAEGNFEIKAIPTEQSYRIHTRAEGYGEKNMEIDIYKAVDNRLDVGTIKLPVANLTVSGVVVDVNDKPLANVEIFSYGDNQPNQDTQTDAEGKFEVKACEGMIRINANSSGPTRLYGRIETEGGSSDVKIVISESSTTRYVPKRPPSLVGKSLPELKEFGIESLPDTNDKMILVCFFDMEQRPSRNCIMQLSKRAQELKEKGIAVVAIQASKIDKGNLDEWIKGQNISIPVGMIESNEEKTRFNWGVKSLPWFVLTDKKHIVNSNGFQVGELENKIKSAQE